MKSEKSKWKIRPIAECPAKAGETVHCPAPRGRQARWRIERCDGGISKENL